MVERVKPKTERSGGGAYYKPPSNLRFVKSGCTLLDLAMGGGVGVLGRMTNIIGDKSTGKTLLAIEACANFNRDYPKGKIWYREAEAAFDQSYAATLGMPIKAIDFGADQLSTVEDFERDLTACCEAAKKSGQPGLYILDSLDALSDEAEMERKVGEATYGTGKAKQLSQMFRKLIRAIGDADVCLIIISQIRDKIGFVIGETTTRSGGKALDFYASLALKLAHIGTLVSTIKGVKRATGVRVKGKVTKNKIGLPFREAQFVIRFGYGVENYEAGMEWLIENKQNKHLDGLSLEACKRLMDDSVDWDNERYSEETAKLDAAVRAAWETVEEAFRPTRSKYG